VDLLCRKYVAAERLDQWLEQRTRSTYPVGERRTIELQSFTGVDLALPVQRQVLGGLRECHPSSSALRSGLHSSPSSSPCLYQRRVAGRGFALIVGGDCDARLDLPSLRL